MLKRTKDCSDIPFSSKVMAKAFFLGNVVTCVKYAWMFVNTGGIGVSTLTSQFTGAGSRS